MVQELRCFRFAVEEVPQATEDGVMTRSRKLEDDKKKKKKRDLLPISSSDKMRKLMLNFITKEEEDKLGLSWAKLKLIFDLTLVFEQN